MRPKVCCISCLFGRRHDVAQKFYWIATCFSCLRRAKVTRVWQVVERKAFFVLLFSDSIGSWIDSAMTKTSNNYISVFHLTPDLWQKCQEIKARVIVTLSFVRRKVFMVPDHFFFSGPLKCVSSGWSLCDEWGGIHNSSILFCWQYMNSSLPEWLQWPSMNTKMTSSLTSRCRLRCFMKHRNAPLSTYPDFVAVKPKSAGTACFKSSDNRTALKIINGGSRSPDAAMAGMTVVSVPLSPAWRFETDREPLMAITRPLLDAFDDKPVSSMLEILLGSTSLGITALMSWKYFEILPWLNACARLADNPSGFRRLNSGWRSANPWYQSTPASLLATQEEGIGLKFGSATAYL